MFGISFGEFAIIFIVALIVIGPQKLPETIRTVGSLIHKLRSFTEQIKNDVSKEFQADELKQSFLETKESLTNQIKKETGSLDEVKKSLHDARHATEHSIRESQQSITQSIKSDSIHPIETHDDHESHGDIADYYHDHHEITAPPKNYHSSVEYHHHAFDSYDDETFKHICQARQFELFSLNNEDSLLAYELKYSSPRELKSLPNIIDNYYDTLIELNHK